MKLIEAMKKIKDLQRKADDLAGKVHTYCADQSHETPMYKDKQKEQINEWIQAHGDVTRKVLELRLAVQRTNLATDVIIELDGQQVTKSIAAWIHRRRDLARLEEGLWRGIGDRGLKEGTIKTSTGEPTQVTIRRYYDPAERDRKVEAFRSEPSTIDSTLEVTNAVTDVVE